MARPKPLKAEDVLKIVSVALARGKVYPSQHFRQRMRERNFDIHDAVSVLENAKDARAKWNTKSSTWNYDLSGTDIEGEELAIRIAIAEDDNGLILVTGF
ncbi:MAG: DUF4258 domain-containing protein [Deltaproteobacteria bacterium]|nr:DUF4258 domain-containing protein [Deltaproteobacteria bacterium]